MRQRHQMSREHEQRAQRDDHRGKGEDDHLRRERGDRGVLDDDLVRVHTGLRRGQSGHDERESLGRERQEPESTRQVGVGGDRPQAKPRQPPQQLCPDPPPPERAEQQELEHGETDQRVPVLGRNLLRIQEQSADPGPQASGLPDHRLAPDHGQTKQNHFRRGGIAEPFCERDDLGDAVRLVGCPALLQEDPDRSPRPPVQRCFRR